MDCKIRVFMAVHDEGFVILACTILIESQSVMNTHRQDA